MLLSLALIAGLAGAAAFGQGVKTRVATGAGHGVWLKADGTVWTWGANGYGQLGTGGDDAWSPVRVPGLDSVRNIAAGSDFTLAVKGDGSVWAWGANESGQLGNGSGKGSPAPVQVGGLTGVIAVAAGGTHAMALRSDGTVWAWGDDGTLKRSNVPKQVPDFSGAVAIAASERHSVAVKSDGTVWVWGDHGAGDLGNGNYGIAGSLLPIAGLSDVTAVAAGYQLTLALKKDGSVWAVGYGAAGGLGNGAKESSTKPVMVAGLTGMKAVAAGYMHALALKADGTVWSWGYNHSSQLGNPRVMAEEFAKPVRTGTLSDVVAIAAASNHSAALTGQGVVWAWGDNDHGALGADPDDLKRSDVPMKAGQPVPTECAPLFACHTGRGKVISICGQQDASNVDKWTHIQYRYGPENGPPELAFPENPDNGTPSLFFSHETSRGDYRVSVRFSNGAYTYRVFSGSKSGGGVEVDDAKGKRLSTIACGERPYLFIEYLRLSLPCDLENPHGAAACKKDPYAAK